MADKTGFVAKRQSHRTWFEMLKEQLIRQANREIKTQRVLREAIKWMGGKYRLKKTIVNMIPEHLCYCEPFGGAGWVLFAKGPSQVEVYNDINKELINFFKVIKNNPVEFLDRTNGLLISRELFQGFLAAHPLDLTEVERAVRFYYLLHFSFGARMKSFLITPLKRPPRVLERVHEDVNLVRKRLINTVIENRSYDEVIASYGRSSTFFIVIRLIMALPVTAAREAGPLEMRSMPG